MTTKHWLGTAAIILAIGTGSGAALAQGEMKSEGGRGGPAAASPRESARPAAEMKGGAAAAERAAPAVKESAESPRGAAGRDQAETRQPARDSKSAEQPSKGERGAPATAQRDRDGSDSRKEMSKESAKDTESKQKQGAADERKTGDKSGDKAGERAAESSKSKTETTKPETSKAETDKTPSGKPGQRDADRNDRNAPAATQQSRDERKDDQKSKDSTANKQGSERNTNQAAQPQRPDSTAAQQTAPDARQRDAAGQTQIDRSKSRTATSVNDQQRTRVFDTLRRDREFDQARTDINVRINIGERLPERVRPRPLPADIVTIVPEYRGYDYTVVHDEVVILDPRSREVVDVIPQGGMGGDRGYASGGSYGMERSRIVLSDDQRQILRRAATDTTTVGSTSAASSGTSSSGPSCLSLRRVPDELARSNPELASYQYLAIGDQVVLIDPQNQKVVQVIDQQQQQ